MISLNITNETAAISALILGIPEDMAGPEDMGPKSRFHLQHDSYPTQDTILHELNALQSMLIRQGIQVFRPINIPNKTQLFVRDLGFVIEDEFFISTLAETRKKELEGIRYLIELFDPEKVVDLNHYEGVEIEGGDVVICGDTVFVGLSERTNQAGYHFLKERFSGKKTVIQLELIIDKDDHTDHSLHLDCSFQPLGQNHAIVYEEGIRNIEQLYDSLQLPDENLFKTNKWQFVRMFPNILSVSDDTVIIEKEFIELKYWLLERGFKVLEVPYKQISKLSGLIRCSTLPLSRL
jgi:N-dimethylarginine dimethylaminohydrolase